jgi:hypothetical protein
MVTRIYPSTTFETVTLASAPLTPKEAIQAYPGLDHVGSRHLIRSSAHTALGWLGQPNNLPRIIHLLHPVRPRTRNWPGPSAPVLLVNRQALRGSGSPLLCLEALDCPRIPQLDVRPWRSYEPHERAKPRGQPVPTCSNLFQPNTTARSTNAVISEPPVSAILTMENGPGPDWNTRGFPSGRPVPEPRFESSRGGRPGHSCTDGHETQPRLRTSLRRRCRRSGGPG